MKKHDNPGLHEEIMIFVIYCCIGFFDIAITTHIDFIDVSPRTTLNNFYLTGTAIAI